MSGSLPLAALALSMLLSSLGTSIANVALPNIAHVFGVPFAAVQWVVLAYLLAVTVLVVLAGRLGDAMGRRRLLLTGLRKQATHHRYRLSDSACCTGFSSR